MATVKKFKAVRPNPAYADKVSSLPYDVMNEQEARAMAKDNAYSYLHVDRSEIDFPEGIDPHTQPVYEKAASNLQQMLSQGVMLQDSQDCLYIYKLNSQIGLVCTTSIDETLDNTIKKHELTRPDKEDDRVNHIDYCNANTSPIFLTYRANTNIDTIINDYISSTEPIYNFTLDDDVTHTVWKIDDDDVCNMIIQQFANIPNLYIADGHHRNASAVRVAQKRRLEHPDYTGDEEFNFYLSVLFPDNQLNILDYNRVVTDLNGLTSNEFLATLKEKFDVQVTTGSYKPQQPAQYGMYLDGVWHILTAKPEIISDDCIKGLDVSILQDNILQPLLGIDDPRTSTRINFVGGIRGVLELERLVDTGHYKVAFSLYPTSMEQLLAVADTSNVMPPKSTWFEPKLRSGLFLHLLS
ncbi:MAG: hypothetical protein BEN19_01630 [Epulopiscium sp. Nuni2H_MBin003]|nr:MAG: hypothetical protein BEN19_01630 [Epulopiscium sp. Nuni2H_MBin003]